MPSETQLLTAWERGLTAGPSGRAMVLTALVAPAADADSLRRLTIGQRDGLLLQLRAQLFGPQLTCVALCPACVERVELDLTVEAITFPPPGDPQTPVEASCDGYRALMRPPQLADLLAVERELPEVRRMVLMSHCLVAAEREGTALTIADLPGSLLAMLATQLAAADPQADVELELRCPACGHAWSAIFDIAGFLWRELDGWARRTLRDVHTLALAYGWSEDAILALSSGRRAAYLEMVRG